MTALALAVKANLGWTHTTHRQGTHHMATEDTEKRTRTVTTNLTQDEYDRWEAATQAAGRVRVGQWVRESVNSMLDAEDGAPIAGEPYSVSTLAAIRSQGRYLNRLARALEQLVDSGQLADDAALARIQTMVVQARGTELPNG